MSSAVVYAILEKNWGNDVLPVPLLGLSQMFYWQYAQLSKFDSQTDRYKESEFINSD